MNTGLTHIPRHIRVRVHQEVDGRFWAESPDVVGCYTQGQTIDEALQNMKDAIFTYYEIPKDQADPSLIRYEGETVGELITA